MTTFQRLTFELDGITAGDYLAYVRNPDPPGLGRALRSMAIHAEPLGDTIEVVLQWDGEAPEPATAEILSGLPMIPEVTRATCRGLEAIAA
jgi:hypothetical protein